MCVCVFNPYFFKNNKLLLSGCCLVVQSARAFELELYTHWKCEKIWSFRSAFSQTCKRYGFYIGLFQSWEKCCILHKHFLSQQTYLECFRQAFSMSETSAVLGVSPQTWTKCGHLHIYFPSQEKYLECLDKLFLCLQKVQF